MTLSENELRYRGVNDNQIVIDLSMTVLSHLDAKRTLLDRIPMTDDIFSFWTLLNDENHA